MNVMDLFVILAVVKLRLIDSDVNLTDISYLGIDDEKQGSCWRVVSLFS